MKRLSPGAGETDERSEAERAVSALYSLAIALLAPNEHSARGVSWRKNARRTNATNGKRGGAARTTRFQLPPVFECTRVERNKLLIFPVSRGGAAQL
jgi:hypothetical protein